MSKHSQNEFMGCNENRYKKVHFDVAINEIQTLNDLKTPKIFS